MRPSNETGYTVSHDAIVYQSRNVALVMRHVIGFRDGVAVRLEFHKGPDLDEDTWLSLLTENAMVGPATDYEAVDQNEARLRVTLATANGEEITALETGSVGREDMFEADYWVDVDFGDPGLGDGDSVAVLIAWPSLEIDGVAFPLDVAEVKRASAKSRELWEDYPDLE
jgi:hypothetical protein